MNRNAKQNKQTEPACGASHESQGVIEQTADGRGQTPAGPAGGRGRTDHDNRPNLHAPPLVIRGAKSQELTAGVDWFRAAGPFFPSQLHRLEGLLNETFGQSEPCKGRYYHDSGLKWSDAVFLFWSEPTPEHEAGKICVEISGGALNNLPVGRMLKLMFNLLHGMRCTRIDLRLDYRAESVGLIEAVITSCNAGELCKARRWKTIEDHTSQGDSLGMTVYLGKRGKDGSGRLVRAYDKGLESKTESAGKWERFEVEYTKSVAAKVGMVIAALGQDVDDDGLMVQPQLAQHVMSFNYGAVDFREKNGQREYSRRPRAAWWQRLIEGVELVTVKQERSATTLESFAAWVKRCVAPTVNDIAKASGKDEGEVLRSLAGDDVRGKADPTSRPVVSEYLKMFQNGA